MGAALFLYFAGTMPLFNESCEKNKAALPKGKAALRAFESRML